MTPGKTMRGRLREPGNVWSLMSGDDDLGYVYLPTTSVTNDMYGGHRPGANLFSDCIVCIDAKTGKKIWHYQTVHHDLFDYDNPAAPILADITVDGRRVKALVQVTKQSFAYVLDRTTGKPVWPIVERPVPQSNVPGEKTSPTQPIPTKPPAFDRQGISEDDLIDFTPELRAEALAIMKQYRIGPLFTPPSVVGDGPNDTKGTIELAGSVGGADWTGAAFDPETGMLYVPSMTNPFVANLIPGKPDETDLRYRAGSRELLQGPRGLPLVKPPYGRITAIDLEPGRRFRGWCPTAMDRGIIPRSRIFILVRSDSRFGRRRSRPRRCCLSARAIRSTCARRPMAAARSCARSTRRLARLSGKPSSTPARPGR